MTLRTSTTCALCVAAALAAGAGSPLGAQQGQQGRDSTTSGTTSGTTGGTTGGTTSGSTSGTGSTSGSMSGSMSGSTSGSTSGSASGARSSRRIRVSKDRYGSDASSSGGYGTSGSTNAGGTTGGTGTTDASSSSTGGTGTMGSTGTTGGTTGGSMGGTTGGTTGGTDTTASAGTTGTSGNLGTTTGTGTTGSTIGTDTTSTTSGANGTAGTAGTTTTTTSGDVASPMPMRRFGNGFFFGLSAGGSMPQGNFNDFYKSGWNVGVPFGWQRQESVLGFRGDIGYSRLSGRDFDISNFGTGSTNDPQIWSGMLDLKLNVPLARGSTWRPALYLLGGGGVHYFRNFTSTFNSTAGTGTGTAFQTQLSGTSQTKFGLNGGAGFSLGLGAADLFVESRYVSVFTRGNNTNWVPITVGITFF